MNLNSFLGKAAEEESSGGGGKGGIGGLFAKFLSEQGKEKVKNPDTGKDVQISSLKGPKGKKLQQDLFEKWKKNQKGDNKENKGGKGKGEVDDKLKSLFKGKSKKEKQEIVDRLMGTVRRQEQKETERSERTLRQERNVQDLGKKVRKKFPGKSTDEIVKILMKQGSVEATSAAHQYPSLRRHLVHRIRTASRFVLGPK